MIFCQERALVKELPGHWEAHALFCNSWLCEWCRPRRKAALIKYAQDGAPNTFITLTVNPERGVDPVHRFEMLADAWRAVVRLAKKKHGDGEVRLCEEGGKPALPYLAVAEATKAGEPHLHILCRTEWIDQRWLSATMERLTGSPIVDIRRIRHTKAVAFYVSKYVGKAPHRFGTKKRYWATRDYRERDDDPPLIEREMFATWYCTKASLDDLEALWRYSGRVVVWIDGALHSYRREKER